MICTVALFLFCFVSCIFHLTWSWSHSHLIWSTEEQRGLAANARGGQHQRLIVNVRPVLDVKDCLYLSQSLPLTFFSWPLIQPTPPLGQEQMKLGNHDINPWYPDFHHCQYLAYQELSVAGLGLIFSAPFVCRWVVESSDVTMDTQ